MEGGAITRYVLVDKEGKAKATFSNMGLARGCASDAGLAVIKETLEVSNRDLIWTPDGSAEWQWGEHTYWWEGG